MRQVASGLGGAGLVLLETRDPADIFDAGSKVLARAMRDAAIPDTTDFDENERLAIIIRFRDREHWQVREDGEWKDLCRKKDTDE